MGPDGSAFYAPPSQLPAGPHGTLIWERPLTGAVDLAGATNTLLLYTQQGISGNLVATSGYVAVPNGPVPVGGWPVVTWSHGTTGIADQCAPTINDPIADQQVNNPLLDAYVAAGYAVVRTDYEGLGTPGDHPYLDGPSEGRAALDAVRAARQFDPDLGNRVVVAGHSQGGQATLWAGSLAPTYTPELSLLGTMAFAPVSQLAVEIAALPTQTSTGLTATIALILRGAQIADPSLNVESLLTPDAAAPFPLTLTECSRDLHNADAYGNIAANDVIAKTANTTGLEQELQANDPGQLTISGPVLIEQGTADTTVRPETTVALVGELDTHADSVTLHTYGGATHATVTQAAQADSLTFLAQVFGRETFPPPTALPEAPLPVAFLAAGAAVAGALVLRRRSRR